MSRSRAQAYRAASAQLQEARRWVNRTCSSLVDHRRQGISDAARAAIESFMADLRDFDDAVSELRRRVVRSVPEPPAPLLNSTAEASEGA